MGDDLGLWFMWRKGSLDCLLLHGEHLRALLVLCPLSAPPPGTLCPFPRSSPSTLALLGHIYDEAVQVL